MPLARFAIFGVAFAPFPYALDVFGTPEIVWVAATPSSLGLGAASDLTGRPGAVLLVVRRLRVRQEPAAAMRALALPRLHPRPLSG